TGCTSGGGGGAVVVVPIASSGFSPSVVLHLGVRLFSSDRVHVGRRRRGGSRRPHS
ncbi:hypothetical protein Taro_046646, partial [Colocasia esculenta]|nr:hypothetical protein [Colocasia esculenta]